MFKKTIIIMFAVIQFFISSASYASSPKIWFVNEGGLSGDQVTNGKVKINAGFFGSFDVESLVKDNPVALDFTAKQSNYHTYAHLSYWIGVIPSSVFLGYGLVTLDYKMSIISAITVIGSSFLTGYFISESRHYMYEAINVYNGVGKEKELEGYKSLSASNFSPYKTNASHQILSFGFSF